MIKTLITYWRSNYFENNFKMYFKNISQSNIYSSSVETKKERKKKKKRLLKLYATKVFLPGAQSPWHSFPAGQ